MNTRIIFLAVAVLASGCAAQPAPDRFDVLSHRDPADPERETGRTPITASSPAITRDL